LLVLVLIHLQFIQRLMRTAILMIILFGIFRDGTSHNPVIAKDSIVFVEHALKKINKNASFTIIPGPVTGTSQKLGFVILPMFVYNLSRNDSLSPPSSSALMAYFDFDGSWVTAVKQSFYWNQNKWRAYISAGVGNMQLKFFGIGRDTIIISNKDTNYVWTTQRELDVTLVCFRKIYKGLYGGLEYRYNRSNLEGKDSLSKVKLVQSGVQTGNFSESVFIPTFIWDNRNNIFWSVKGYYAALSFQSSNGFFFSSGDYGILAGWVNGYHCLLRNSKKLILAWHVYAETGWGSRPYVRYATYGQGDGVTGYTRGKYVNNSEATVQAELRYEIWKFISCGGYAGTGKVFASYKDFEKSAWLHYGGVNLYLNIIPSQNVRLRLGAAVARRDYGLYIGIGQGF
jgi:hypothetical protein